MQFLVSLGHAFIRRFVFRASAPSEPPRDSGGLTITPDVVGGFLTFRQGMRLQYDAARRQVVVLAAASSHPEDYEPHFGAVAVDADNVTSVRWYRLYKGDGEVEFLTSHPYAMCASCHGGGDGYVFAGHSFHPSRCNGRPVGRALKVRPDDGSVLWDTAFAANGLLLNTECYGVCSTPGGLVLTCGTGAHDGNACAAEDCWRCLVVVLADEAGASGGKVRLVQPFTSNEPDAGGNNAGEDVLATPDGGVVVVIDSQSFGTPGTGGNFALMKLRPETFSAGFCQALNAQRSARGRGGVATGQASPGVGGGVTL